MEVHTAHDLTGWPDAHAPFPPDWFVSAPTAPSRTSCPRPPSSCCRPPPAPERAFLRLHSTECRSTCTSNIAQGARQFRNALGAPQASKPPAPTHREMCVPLETGPTRLTEIVYNGFEVLILDSYALIGEHHPRVGAQGMASQDGHGALPSRGQWPLTRPQWPRPGAGLPLLWSDRAGLDRSVVVASISCLPAHTMQHFRGTAARSF
jgi:hypothetical protein